MHLEFCGTFFCLMSRSTPHRIIFVLVCFRNIFTIVLGIDLFPDLKKRKKAKHTFAVSRGSHRQQGKQGET